MPGFVAGTFSITGHQTRHAATLLTGRNILIALGVIVAIVLLLAVPVWWGAGFDSFTKNMSKAARPTFVFGFGVLIVGLASGVRIIDIAGGAVMAAVVLGKIVEHYLTGLVTECCHAELPTGCAAGSPRRSGRSRCRSAAT